MSGARAGRDALVVGMSIVPSLFSRNKMFSLFERPEVRRARTRSSELRGIVRQLCDAGGAAEIVEWRRGGETTLLVYRIASVSFERRVELPDAEAACLAWLAARAGLVCLPPSPDDRATVEAALRRLGGDAMREAGRLAAHDERRLPVLQDPEGRDPEQEGPRD